VNFLSPLTFLVAGSKGAVKEESETILDGDPLAATLSKGREKKVA
jgi:hypothetical protein